MSLLLAKSVDIITEWYTERILCHDTIPLTMGGDHTIALPLLRSMAAKHGYGKVGLVHVDAHADVNEHMFGEQIAHGTPFRRAVEENLIGESSPELVATRHSLRFSPSAQPSLLCTIGRVCVRACFTNLIQTAPESSKLAFAGRGILQKISSGAATRGFEWFKLNSAGTSR